MPANTQAKYGRTARGQPLPLITPKKLLVEEGKNINTILNYSQFSL